MPPQQGVHVGACAVLVRDAGHEEGKSVLLLCRDGKEGVARHGRGQWAFPGGWIDFNEDPQYTACRELKEEVGVKATVGRFAGWSADTHPEEHLHVVTLFFMFEQYSGLPFNAEPEKASDVRWFTLSDVKRLSAEGKLFAATESFLRLYGTDWLLRGSTDG